MRECNDQVESQRSFGRGQAVSVSSAACMKRTRIPFDSYAAELAWGGGWRPVLVSGVGDEVLLGMRLRAGTELRIAVVPGGVVEITPLP